MTELAPDVGFGRKNPKLKNALLQHKTFSLAGLSERLFGLLFSGLVYPQIWEDPIVDMEAMQLGPEHRIVADDLVIGGDRVYSEEELGQRWRAARAAR